MNRLPVSLGRACALWCAVSLTGVSALAQEPAPRPPAAPAAQANDLDAFMEKVLARRDVNRRTLDQYVLDETESFEILGPGRWPLHRTRRDYTWYVRDGMHVRSPVRFNGVKVGDEARERYETNWIQRERGRQERQAKKENEKDKDKEKEREPGEIAITAEGVQISTGGPAVTEPRFVSEAYFMDFKFEPGNYYLAGREQLEGQQVVKVEYYPTKMFGDSDEERNERQKKEKSEEKPARRHPREPEGNGRSRRRSSRTSSGG